MMCLEIAVSLFNPLPFTFLLVQFSCLSPIWFVIGLKDDETA